MSQLRTFLPHLASTLLLAVAFGCAPSEPRKPDQTTTRSRFLMGTPLTITVPEQKTDSESIEEAFDEVARIESLISTWRDDSVLAEINRTPVGIPAHVDPEIASLLEETIEWSRKTEDAFDPAAGRILFGWDLRGEGRVPTPDEIASYLAESGAEHLAVDLRDGTVTRQADLLVEEGGFGKGWALDHASSILHSSGIRHAILDFGGQVSVWGQKVTRIGVAHPEHRMTPAVELEIAEGSIATSSGSERFFESDGHRYSHLLDPRTGLALPPRGSVTVVHERGLVSDILATALYVMGPDEGIDWAERNGVAAIFVVPDPDGGWIVRPTKEATRSIAIRAIDPEFKIERN